APTSPSTGKPARHPLGQRGLAVLCPLALVNAALLLTEPGLGLGLDTKGLERLAPLAVAGSGPPSARARQEIEPSLAIYFLMLPWAIVSSLRWSDWHRPAGALTPFHGCTVGVESVESVVSGCLTAPAARSWPAGAWCGRGYRGR